MKHISLELTSLPLSGMISKTKDWFFEKVYKIDKCLARQIKKTREKIQINHTMKYGQVLSWTIIQIKHKIDEEYYEQL